MPFVFVFFMIFGFLFGIDENSAEIVNLRYKKDKIITKDVFFPKRTPDYIDSLMNTSNIESYFELAKAYYILGKPEISNKYFKEYEKLGGNTFKQALYYLNTLNYTKFYEIFDDLLNNKKFDELQILKSVLLKKSKEKINEQEEFKERTQLITKLNTLFLKYDEKDFLNYYSSNEWSETELNEIIDFLSKKDIKKNEGLVNLYFSLVNSDKIKEYFKKRIKNFLDKDRFRDYFSYFDAKGIELKFENFFEELLYLEYKKDSRFNDKFEEVLNFALSKNDFEMIYDLYNLKEPKDFKIIYNLSFVSEKYFYKIIEDIYYDKFDLGEDKKSILNSMIEEYLKIYSDGIYSKNVKKIIIELESDIDKKIALIDSELEKNQNQTFFGMKMELLNKKGNYKEVSDQINILITTATPIKVNIENMIIALENQKRNTDILDFLKDIEDKSYYMEFCKKNKIVLDYNLNIVDEFIKKGQYDKVLDYKEFLNYEQLNSLVKSGDGRFLEIAREKYPFEKKWINLEDEKNFYFNENFKTDEAKISEIIKKKDRTDAEKFYLAKYYYENKKYSEALDSINGIVSRYKLEKPIIKMYLSILEKTDQNKKLTSEIENNLKILNWDEY